MFIYVQDTAPVVKVLKVVSTASVDQFYTSKITRFVENHLHAAPVQFVRLD
jgi:hypothetical protein